MLNNGRLQNRQMLPVSFYALQLCTDKMDFFLNEKVTTFAPFCREFLSVRKKTLYEYSCEYFTILTLGTTTARKKYDTSPVNCSSISRYSCTGKVFCIIVCRPNLVLDKCTYSLKKMGLKGGYLDFSHLTELKHIYITEIHKKKKYKSINKNHKIKRNNF